MESDDAGKIVPETETPKPKSFFSRLAGTYSSPRSTFKEMGESPRVLAPIIALILLGLLAGVYLSKTLDFESAAVSQMQAMVERGAMTKEQMEQRLPMVVKTAGIQVIVTTTIGSVLVALAIAGFAKLFSLFVAAENRFKAVFSVTAYVSLAISIVQYALIVLILQLKGIGEVDPTQLNSLVASNLGAILSSFFGNDVLPKFLMSLARGVDIFAIWMIALLSTGYSAVSRKLKTSTAATWLAAAYVILIVLGAAISSLFSLPGSR